MKSDCDKGSEAKIGTKQLQMQPSLLNLVNDRGFNVGFDMRKMVRVLQALKWSNCILDTETKL